MVVTCTNCQAKFRVPDERIGPRGAKVRCSRCQTIFVVLPEIGSVPVAPAPAAPDPALGFDLESHSGRVRAPRPETPFAGRAADPAPPPAPLPPPTDPFAANFVAS